MDKVKAIKKVIKYVWIVWGIICIFLLFQFAMHGYRVRKFNAKVRSLNPTSITTEAELSIHPRGQLTDSWEKDDAIPGKLLYAKIYEATIVNHSGTAMTDWSIRIRIKEDCYLNNAWCGKLEVHQFVEGKKIVQKLDLRNYEESKIKLEHNMVGQDLMIPLHKNDYIIYYPSKKQSDGELPIRSGRSYAGEVNIGFILYNEREESDLSDYALTYQLHKSLFTGTEGVTYAILFAIMFWLFLFLLFLTFIIFRFEGRISMQENITSDALHLCAALGDSKMVFAKGHSNRVASYAKILAEGVGMDERDSLDVYRAAMLHDVGNYYVSDLILSKPGTLSNEEKEIIKTHTTMGAKMVSELVAIPYVSEAVLFHHEWYDGNGYPTGKRGDEIPLIARLIAVAEAYDAMSHHRPYRKKLTEEEIFEEFKSMRAKQFDPVVVDAFFERYEKIKGVEQ